MLHCTVRQVWKHTKETFSLNHGYQLLRETFLHGTERDAELCFMQIIFRDTMQPTFSPPRHAANIVPTPTPPPLNIFQLMWNKMADGRLTTEESRRFRFALYLCVSGDEHLKHATNRKVASSIPDEVNECL
jgi:hypothetical protein